MTGPFVFASDSWINATGRWTRWCRQLARAKQNILEGCQASGTSKETEIKLINVARASLEELLEDFRDYLRVRNHRQWEKDSKEAKFVRKIGAQKNTTYESYRTYIETRDADVVANILICIIHQTNYLLDQQLRALEQTFLAEGGLRERMTRARLEAWQKKNIGPRGRIGPISRFVENCRPSRCDSLSLRAGSWRSNCLRTSRWRQRCGRPASQYCFQDGEGSGDLGQNLLKRKHQSIRGNP
jgi:four helix bundle suffix protein